MPATERIKYDVVKSPQTVIMTLERIGPYRIVRLLGKGGMGAVYEGVHEAIERRVAIKVLHAELARRQDIATRFFNEFRKLSTDPSSTAIRASVREASDSLCAEMRRMDHELKGVPGTWRLYTVEP